MAQEFTVVTASYVNLQITSTLNNFPSEKRFQKDVTIGTLKGKLEMVTGSISASMELNLFDKDGKLVVVMSDDNALLGSYPVEDGMRIHVQDSDPNRLRGEFEDLSKVEKYEIPEDEYAKRTDSVLAFKKKHKMGQFREVDPEEAARQEALKKEKEAEEEKLAGTIEVGSRCQVNVPTAPPVKRGTVMFVESPPTSRAATQKDKKTSKETEAEATDAGPTSLKKKKARIPRKPGKTEFKPGFWIGVKYDEPLGKNDGSVQGKRYFECQPKYGGFVKPQYVTTGDFPEEDMDFEDDEM